MLVSRRGQSRTSNPVAGKIGILTGAIVPFKRMIAYADRRIQVLGTHHYAYERIIEFSILTAAGRLDFSRCIFAACAQ